MNNAVEDRVCERGISYYFISAIDGDLACDEDGAAVVAVLDDLEQIPTPVSVERLRAPYVDGFYEESQR